MIFVRGTQVYRAASGQRCVSSTSRGQTSAAIEQLLKKPAWSTKSLLPSKSDRESGKDAITSSQLDHLLKLAALPSFQDEGAKTDMLKDLADQLHFVKSVQEVDTTGVEPLRNLTQDQNQGSALSYKEAVEHGEALKRGEQKSNFRYPSLAKRTKNKHYVVDGGLVNTSK